MALSRTLPTALAVEDINEMQVLYNALECLGDDLDADDEDQPVIARLLARLDAAT